MSYGTATHIPQTGETAPATWGSTVNANFVALNGFFYEPLFPKHSGLPLTNVTAAGYSIMDSSAGGTPTFSQPILGFNGTAISGRGWNFSMPRGYGSGLTVNGAFYMGSAHATKAAVFAVYLGAVSSGDAITNKAYAAQNLGTISVPNNAGTVQSFSVSLTNIDSVVAGDNVQLAFLRVGTDAGDTANDGELKLTRLDAFFNLQA
jgi:hypothetical protein